MFLRQGMTRVAIGIVLGLVPAWLLGRQMTELLYRTSPLDPLVIGTTIGVLLLSGLAACVVPARRAAAIDPAVSLREQ
jgi:ABC-type antimicrobial peptide transport system permease subunit